VITEVTVNSTAVESMTNDSAVVLVSASSRVTNSAGAQQEPRSWRLSVNLQRDGGQIKMSKVEFVP
jgi:Mce-associated membrane protein